MSVASWRSETATDALAAVRVGGGIRMDFAPTVDGTRAKHLAEADGWRVRFPRSVNGCEAVLLNTGGGIAGGDTVRLEASLQAGATVTVTSATAERVYRALATPTRMDVALALGPAASLAWLPQETILYSGARLTRRIEVALAADARLTLADIVVLGRRAFAEVMTAGSLDDRWTIRRGGLPVHAEAVHLGGEIDAMMQRAAIGGGAHVVATLLQVAPDAADRLEAVRTALGEFDATRVGASAWDGKLLVRTLGDRSDRVRAAIAAAAAVLTGQPMPRVWAMASGPRESRSNGGES